MDDCMLVGGLLEVCVGDVVEVFFQGGHKFYGEVVGIGRGKLMLYCPPLGGKASYLVVDVEKVAGLRLVSCGNVKVERTVCRG